MVWWRRITSEIQIRSNVGCKRRTNLALGCMDGSSFNNLEKPLKSESEETQLLRLRLMNGFALALLLVAWILKPFKPADSNGPGLNELLQTDLMVIHPPLIFLAYSLCIVLSCIAISSLLTSSKGIKTE